MNTRFLIINPFGIGDVLFTLPLIRSIQSQVPQAWIGYLVNRRSEKILPLFPGVNDVIVYNRDEFKAAQKVSWQSGISFFRRTVGQLRAGRYDVAIDLSLTGYASFYCMLAGIRTRTGLNFKNRSPFLTHKVLLTGFDSKPVAEYYMDVLEAIGLKPLVHSMALDIPPGLSSWAQEYLRSQMQGEKTWIAIAPGGGESWGKDAVFKRWPAKKYAQLIETVISRFKIQIVLLGNAKDETLCKEIQNLVKYPILNACALTTLPETIAVFSVCRLAIVNDGGLLHMAVASGTKTVSIFGPVDENIYGPFPSQGHRVVTQEIACRPCYRQFRRAMCDHVSCLSQIEVNDVLEAIDKTRVLPTF